LARAGLIAFGCLWCAAGAWAQGAEPGALRVRVIDQDWDVPLAGALVQVLEAEKRVTSGEDGNVLFDALPGGSYTLVISATGFEKKVVSQVVVVPGDAKSEEVRLNGAFTDMEEFVVKDIDLMSGGGDIAQLEIRSQSSGMIDNIGADMMSKAGVSTAAAAMRMVTGANVQDGKYAVIRGLGDRYTATLLNGVRLPTSDKDKRAVQLDQFPAAMIESIQVTKTFTPDQQGDASGGGINIITKSVPDKAILSASVSTEYDSNATGNDSFKTVKGGGNSFGGMRGLKNHPFWSPGDMSDPRGLTTEKRSSVIQADAPPVNYGFKLAAGDSVEMGDWRFGALLNGSYSQKYKYREGEKNAILNRPPENPDDLAVLNDDKKKTVETSSDEQLWSTGLTLGAKSENHELKLTTLYTHQSREVVDLRYEPFTPSNVTTNRRTKNISTTRGREFETLSQYSENGNGSIQLAGKHVIEPLNRLELDWTGAYNMSESTEPDRQTFDGGYSSLTTVNGDGAPSTLPSDYYSRMNGTLSRRWQDIREESFQVQANAKLPFTLIENEGYLKTGLFRDGLDRFYRNRNYSFGPTLNAEDEYDFSHFDQVGSTLPIDFKSPNQDSTDYNGRQEISAFYGMLRAPLPGWLDIIGGVRLESTYMKTAVWSAAPNMDDQIFVTRIVKNSDGINVVQTGEKIPEEDGSATTDRVDALPAIAMNFKKIEDISIRLAYSQTIARPTFKELTPVNYLDVDPNQIFVGNPNLKMSSLENYDARVEWRPGGGVDVLAVSLFYKTIADPIQYTTYSDPSPGSDKQYIFPENYNEAWVKGVEFEARKSLDFIYAPLKDLSVGSNLTLQDSFVGYTDSLKKSLQQVNVFADGRVMDGQPAYLFNVNLLYQNEASGLMSGLFYNYKGETFVSGEGAADGLYTPHVVEKPLGTLDFTLGLRFKKHWRVGFDVKNILDPVVESVYRRPNGDLPNTSHKYGRTFGVSLGYDW
jgi:outer membrane receptor protein involved in Fe transport